MSNEIFDTFIQTIPCNFNFTEKAVHFPSTDITFFLLFFYSESYHLLFFFYLFFSKVLKPKCKTPFSKLN